MGYQGSLRSPRSMRMHERREYVTVASRGGCLQKNDSTSMNAYILFAVMSRVFLTSLVPPGYETIHDQKLEPIC